MTDEGELVAGRYRLTEQIGRGGMGMVWRVADEVLGRQVALKRLAVQPHLSDDQLATLYERMRREARSAARIVHPNVVVVDDEEQPCIVMEYVPAPTLGELLKDGRTLPPEEAARVGLGMVAALRAAHGAGVLHRDVKPGNVMIGMPMTARSRGAAPPGPVTAVAGGRKPWRCPAVSQQRGAAMRGELVRTTAQPPDRSLPPPTAREPVAWISCRGCA